MKKLLVVLVVMALVLTICSVPVFAADTTVYADYEGGEVSAPSKDDNWNNDRRADRDGAWDLDYYEVDVFAPETQLEEGKVYKAIYLFTINNVNAFDSTGGWEVKCMPVEEYYFNITNADLWDGEGTVKTAVVVPFVCTDASQVKLKLWTHGALNSGANGPDTLDGIMVVGADFNAYSLEDYDNVIEGVANTGSAKDTYKPADDAWTVSDPDAVGVEGDEGTGDEGTGDEGNTDAGDDDAGEEDNGTTDVPATGDVSALLALVAAGAAAFGGLKLRKR